MEKDKGIHKKQELPFLVTFLLLENQMRYAFIKEEFIFGNDFFKCCREIFLFKMNQ